MLTTEQPSRAFSREADLDSESHIDRKRLADALADLHRLLEEYAPSWYTPEHHQKAESALQLTGKH